MANLCDLIGRDKKHLVQLCLPYEKITRPLEFPVIVQEKLDGVFVIAYVDKEGECSFYSRTGEEYVSMGHLKEDFVKLAKNTGLSFFLFEAYNPDYPQSVISGWCRDTKATHHKLWAYIHDVFTYEEFLGEHDLPCYRDRFKRLYCTGDSYFYLFRVPGSFIDSMETLLDYKKEVEEKGGEGVIIRDPYSCDYYPGKRKANLIKWKKTLTFDLRVVGVSNGKGKGKYRNIVGRLICQDAAGKEILVGSGLTDEQRKAWWEDPLLITGKIVEVEAMCLSTKGILREPRFKGIRHDKAEVDLIC